jgi:hypothetical protein
MMPIEVQLIFLYGVGAIWLAVFLEYLLDKLTK